MAPRATAGTSKKQATSAAKVATRAKRTEHWLRLERGDPGSPRRFWEILRDGEVVSTRFGIRGDEGRRSDKRMRDEAAAEREVGQLIARKRAAGYSEPLRPAPAQSLRGVSVRNPDLEAAIERDPNDLQAYVVYADWLQEQRDPRGELMAVQCARHANPTQARLADAEGELFKRYGADLLGPLERLRLVRSAGQSYTGLVWKCGFIEGAKLRRMSATPLSATVRLLLEHPSARFLQRLILGRPTFAKEPERDYAPTFEVLREKAPRTLRWLFLGDHARCSVNLEPLVEGMTQLRELFVHGDAVSFGDGTRSNVEGLTLRDTTVETLSALAATRSPRVARLDVTLSVEGQLLRHAQDVEGERVRLRALSEVAGALVSLFDRDALPNLEQLSIRRFWEGLGGPEHADPLMTIAAVVPSHLKSLTLEFPMADGGVRFLLGQARQLRGIGSIRIPTQSIANPKLRHELSSSLPNVDWVAEVVSAYGAEDLLQP